MSDANTDAEWSALVVDDDAGVRQSLRLCLEADGARVLGVGTVAGALEALERGRFQVLFLDLWLGAESGLTALPELLRRQPGVAVIVITAFATFETAVEAMRLGAADYLPKPFTPTQVRQAARRHLDAQRLQRRVRELESRLGELDAGPLFETHSASFRSLLQTAERAARTDSVVLLRGESGTGKNLLARWLASRSGRAAGPFVSVNCPALSGELMASSLFGHRKGAFTGATADVPGKVQEAEGGTLFLDEVGDLGADAQSRLLRFLNDRTYERLGEARERRADVRVLAATNRPLEEDVRSGRFREDLFFRLNVVPLTLPPLRERKDDLLPFARHYLAFFARAQARPGFHFSPAAERAIAAYDWPGNLRELRNAVERATILAATETLSPEDLSLPSVEASPAPASAAAVLGGECSLEALEREHIARVLARTSSLEQAARTLGIDVRTLHRKRQRYGLA